MAKLDMTALDNLTDDSPELLGRHRAGPRARKAARRRAAIARAPASSELSPPSAVAAAVVAPPAPAPGPALAPPPDNSAAPDSGDTSPSDTGAADMQTDDMGQELLGASHKKRRRKLASAFAAFATGGMSAIAQRHHAKIKKATAGMTHAQKRKYISGRLRKALGKFAKVNLGILTGGASLALSSKKARAAMAALATGGLSPAVKAMHHATIRHHQKLMAAHRAKLAAGPTPTSTAMFATVHHESLRPPAVASGAIPGSQALALSPGRQSYGAMNPAIAMAARRHAHIRYMTFGQWTRHLFPLTRGI